LHKYPQQKVLHVLFASKVRQTGRSGLFVRWVCGWGSLAGMVCLLVPLLSFAADVLDYDAVIERALTHSHDVRMSRLDVTISESSLRRAYSLYYPTIKAQWNSEYVKDLSDGTYQLTSVGDTVLVQNTMYQSSLLLAGTYNLFDFGATPKRVSIARSDVDAKRTTYRQTVRDVKLKILNLYSDLLTSSRELETKRQLLTLYKELSLTKERYYKAGRISKVEMVDEAVKAVKTLDEIDTLKLKVSTLSKDLSFYTGDAYEAETLRVSDLSEPAGQGDSAFDIDRTPESRIYALEIEKKQAEVDALTRELYPRLGLYSKYVWYGSNENEAGTSARYMQPRNFFIGLAATLTLFEGFKSNAEIDKAKLELERLKIERSRKLSELSARHAKVTQARRTYTSGIANQKDMLKKVEDKLAMVERLEGQKLIDRTDFLNQKIELLGQKLELTKVVIAKIAAVKELEVLSEGMK